jgi:glucose/arabinose dehydrogenase
MMEELEHKGQEAQALTALPQEAPEETPAAEEETPVDLQAQIQAAVAEAERQWQQEQEERLRQAVAAERGRYERLVRQVEQGRRLQAGGLDPAFAPLLLGADEQEDLQKLEDFQTLYRAQLSGAMAQLMRGVEVPEAATPTRGYDRETLRTMSPKEINDHWAEIAQTMAT